jgi:hypothetical protein
MRPWRLGKDLTLLSNDRPSKRLSDRLSIIGSGDRTSLGLASEPVGRETASLLLVTAMVRRSRNLFKRASRLLSVASGDEKFFGSTAIYNSDTRMSLKGI